jgi:hypothetical protein
MTITIESGHKMPEPRRTKGDGVNRRASSERGMLREALTRMEIGQSFTWNDNVNPFMAAYDVGVKIKTAKLNGNGYRIWRAQ